MWHIEIDEAMEPGKMMLNAESVKGRRYPWCLAGILSAAAIAILFMIHPSLSSNGWSWWLAFAVVPIPLAFFYIAALPICHREGPYPNRIIRGAIVVGFLLPLSLKGYFLMSDVISLVKAFFFSSK